MTPFKRMTQLTPHKVEKEIRALAKTGYYQTLYASAKELPLKIFKNDYDLTYLQIEFLRYLNFYYSLLIDISLEDLDERIMENTIYEDAYSLYKRRKDRETLKESKKPNTGIKNKNAGNVVGNIDWVFKRPARNIK